MSSRTSQVLAAVVTALQGINGGALPGTLVGNYSQDVSATGRVILGRPSARGGPTPPAIWVSVGQLRTSHAPELGRYRRDLIIDIQARAPAAPFVAPLIGAIESKATVAPDFLSDICTALEANRSLVTNGTRLVIDLIVEGATFDGDEVGIPGCAVVLAQVSVYWFADSAAGV